MIFRLKDKIIFDLILHKYEDDYQIHKDFISNLEKIIF